MLPILRFLGALLAPVIALLNSLRWLWVGLLVIGLPLYIYFAFIAKEPVFTVENDVELGRQSEASIAADPDEYPLLSRQQYPEAYAHIDRIVGKVVRSPVVEQRDLIRVRQREDPFTTMTSSMRFARLAASSTFTPGSFTISMPKIILRESWDMRSRTPSGVTRARGSRGSSAHSDSWSSSCSPTR